MDMISFNLGMIVVYYYINYIIIGQCFYRVVWEWRVLFIKLNIVFRVVFVYCLLLFVCVNFVNLVELLVLAICNFVDVCKINNEFCLYC